MNREKIRVDSLMLEIEQLSNHITNRWKEVCQIKDVTIPNELATEMYTIVCALRSMLDQLNSETYEQS